MIGIQADYADRGVRLVAVNSNDASRYPGDSFEQMTARAAERGFNFDYLHDPTQDVARALGSERTPEVFVFDRGRRLVYHGAIDDNRDETAVDAPLPARRARRRPRRRAAGARRDAAGRAARSSGSPSGSSREPGAAAAADPFSSAPD